MRSPGSAGAAPVVDPSAAITGLLIHCCADGLAMGAAFLSGNARLTMIIAAAMVRGCSCWASACLPACMPAARPPACPTPRLCQQLRHDCAPACACPLAVR